MFDFERGNGRVNAYFSMVNIFHQIKKFVDGAFFSIAFSKSSTNFIIQIILVRKSFQDWQCAMETFSNYFIAH